MKDIAPLIAHGFEFSRLLDAEGESKAASNVRTALRSIAQSVEGYHASDMHHPDVELYTSFKDMASAMDFVAQEIARARSRAGYNAELRDHELEKHERELAEAKLSKTE